MRPPVFAAYLIGELRAHWGFGCTARIAAFNVLLHSGVVGAQCWALTRAGLWEPAPPVARTQVVLVLLGLVVLPLLCAFPLEHLQRRDFLSNERCRAAHKCKAA